MSMVGKGIPKYDGIGHVTGTTPFVDDVFMFDTLICKAYRSPVSRGKIKSIDTSLAERLPGVCAVITSKDVPSNCHAGDWPVLATDEVRFKGEVIAAVAAVDEDTAQEAVSLIKVDIEELTPVFDPKEAIKPGAPQIKPTGNKLMFGDKDFNLIHFGNVEEGFKEADQVFECEYFYPVAEHSPLETQTSLVIPHQNGSLTIYSTSQDLHLHLSFICGILKMPLSKVNLIGGVVGGAFGGKNDLHADPVTALLALKAGKPVKWRWTREEELTCSTVRGAWYIKITDGIKKNGRIVARIMEDLMDGGAYASLNLYSSTKHAYFCVGPYYIPNVKVIVRCAFTNKVPSSSMRGFGLTGGAYAEEVHMEKLARLMGMDSFQFRMINALRKGEPTHTSSIPDSVAAIEVLQKLAVNTGVKLPQEFLDMRSDERRQYI